ncbi:hypothetical protein CTI12_AA568530 [Artemisia annua]|uniref:C2H2-type domain-containing protein n=1 Tax=Artemisia annua TaxID=35608 RepID=A0A2U1KT10_ARTAN|nr:hypothetical protein CTI12_AA568530 [Artemisia annua]
MNPKTPPECKKAQCSSAERFIQTNGSNTCGYPGCQMHNTTTPSLSVCHPHVYEPFIATTHDYSEVKESSATHYQVQPTNNAVVADGKSFSSADKGPSTFDVECLQQTKKRGRPHKNMSVKQTMDELNRCQTECSNKGRKRGRPRKQVPTKDADICHTSDDTHVVGQPPIPVTPATKDCVATNVARAYCRQSTNKRKKDYQDQGLAEYMCRPEPDAIVHVIGEPSPSHIPHNVCPDAEPSSPQNVDHQPQRQKRNRRAAQPFKRCVRHRSLISSSEHASDNSTNNTDEGSSSFAAQGNVGLSISYGHLPSKVSAGGEPSSPQNVDHQPQRQKRNGRAGQPFRRSVRQRSLISSSQNASDNCRNNTDQGSSSYATQDVSVAYDDLGDCTERCQYCNAAFWRGERLIGHRFTHATPQYHLCCGGDSNGPDLDPEIVQGLIHFLDTHNELVQIFRTARDKCAEHDIPEFKVRLYSGEAPRGYDLPASQTLGAIVFDSGSESESNYDVILEYRDGAVKRISKIHKYYMSLQFPLIFIYGQSGYHTKLMLRTANPDDEPKRVSMNAFYTYQMEDNPLAVVQHPREGKAIQAANAPQITAIHELRPTSHSKLIEARAVITKPRQCFVPFSESSGQGLKNHLKQIPKIEKANTRQPKARLPGKSEDLRSRSSLQEKLGEPVHIDSTCVALSSFPSLTVEMPLLGLALILEYTWAQE